jgi:hypothetical protein
MLFENEEPEEINNEELDVKRDKIFQNLYEETELDTSDINFRVDPSFESKSYEYTLDEKLVLEKVDHLLTETKKYDRFRLSDEEGNFKKLNKNEINEVYQFVINNLSNEPKIEIFSVLSSIFDINSDKFYESLSNTFKTELITELKERGFLANRNSLF